MLSSEQRGRIRRVVRPVVGAGMYVMAIAGVTATPAFGMNDFSGGSILQQSRQTFDKDQYNKNTIAGAIRRISAWLLGVYIALMVLKIVLTAIDRIIMGGDLYAYPEKERNGNKIKVDGTPLQSIPVVGAYPPPDIYGSRSQYGPGQFSDYAYHDNGDHHGYSWKDIFLNFAGNLAIVLGAWVFVYLITGLIEWVYGAAGAGGASSGNASS